MEHINRKTAIRYARSVLRRMKPRNRIEALIRIAAHQGGEAAAAEFVLRALATPAKASGRLSRH